MSEWESISLDQFVTFQRGFDLPISTFVDGNVPVFGSTSILGYHNEAKVKAPGVITGRSGTLGQFQYTEEDFFPHNTSLWVKDFKGNNPKFAYYLMQCLDFSGFNSGGAVPTLNRNVLKSFTVHVPPLPIQQKIAAILSAYDDLIENNLKQIKLLEEMAQITYEEWFVRFKFPNHKNTPVDEKTGLPLGWEEINIGDLVRYEIGGGWGEDFISDDFSAPAYVIRGTDIDSLSLGGTIDCVPFRYHKKSNLQSRKLQILDIVFEVSGGSQNEGVAKTILLTEELLNRFDADVMCASFCKLVRLHDKNNSYFVFHYLRFLRKVRATEVFEIRGASSIVNYNWTGFLKFQKIIMPSVELIKDFNEKVAFIHKQINLLGSQNQLLKEARDILLPRLMTGKIEV